MKVSLADFYDPKTNTGIEEFIILLCIHANLNCYQEINNTKKLLHESLLRQSELKSIDLNTAITTVIPEAANLFINFNELCDPSGCNQIDVTLYDDRYGGIGSASLLRNKLRLNKSIDKRSRSMSPRAAVLYLRDSSPSPSIPALITSPHLMEFGQINTGNDKENNSRPASPTIPYL